MTTLQEAISALRAAAVTDQAPRRASLAIGEHYHQGDVYIVRVADDHPRSALAGTNQVAVGDGVGARHMAVGEGVQVFEPAADSERNAALFLPGTPEEQCRACTGRVVVAPAPWRLEHPQHAAGEFDAGTYVVVHQWNDKLRQRTQD